MWFDDFYDNDGDHWDNDDEDNFSELFGDYKKGKAQKTLIKEELLPIAWHPSRYGTGVCQKMKNKIQKN